MKSKNKPTELSEQQRAFLEESLKEVAEGKILSEDYIRAEEDQWLRD